MGVLTFEQELDEDCAGDNDSAGLETVLARGYSILIDLVSTGLQQRRHHLSINGLSMNNDNTKE